MKLAARNLIVPAALTLLSSQALPLCAQSISDVVGSTPHHFVTASSPDKKASDTTASTPKTAGSFHRSKFSGLKTAKHHRIAADDVKTAPASAAQPLNIAITETTPHAAKTGKPGQKLTPAQIKHHLKMLALKAAHRKAHRTALNGFDQVGAAGTQSLDSMTKDATTSSPSDTGAKDMSVGGAVGRAIAALAIVLGLAYGSLQFMRKKGIGVPKSEGTIDLSSPDLQIQSSNPSTIDQFQLAVEKAQSRITTPFEPENGVQRIAKSIEDLEVLGSQELPGTAHTLYKVKIGDRVLLLGGSLSGALTSLTEWDVETKPETEQKFENMLNQMTMSVTPTPSAPPAAINAIGGSQADALRTATQRLSRSARRMAETGSKAANEG